MGAVPSVFFTVVRESFPQHSIMEIPIRLSIRSLGQQDSNTFLMLSLNKEPMLPRFIEVDKSHISTLQQLNQQITGQGEGEQDRIDLVGLPAPGDTKNMSIFKSYLSRKLYLHLLRVADLTTWSGCKLLETRTDFAGVLRKVY